MAFERGRFALSREFYQRSSELGRELLDAVPSDQALQRREDLLEGQVAGRAVEDERVGLHGLHGRSSGGPL